MNVPEIQTKAYVETDRVAKEVNSKKIEITPLGLKITLRSARNKLFETLDENYLILFLPFCVFFFGSFLSWESTYLRYVLYLNFAVFFFYFSLRANNKYKEYFIPHNYIHSIEVERDLGKRNFQIKVNTANRKYIFNHFFDEEFESNIKLFTNLHRFDGINYPGGFFKIIWQA
jgi:hypothetical protein